MAERIDTVKREEARKKTLGIRLKDLNEISKQKYEKFSPDMKGFVDDYLVSRNETLNITSSLREKQEGDKDSQHHTANAGDFTPDSVDVDWLMNTKEGLELLVKYDLGVLDETNPRMLKTTDGTGAHFHIGKDSFYANIAKERLQNFGDNTPIFLSYDMFQKGGQSKYILEDRERFVTRQGDNKYNYLGENADKYMNQDIEEFNNQQIPVDLAGFTGTSTTTENIGISQDEIQKAVQEALLEQDRLKDESRSKLQAESSKRKEEDAKLEAVMAMFSNEGATPSELYNQARQQRQTEDDGIYQYQQIPIQEGLQGIEGFGIV